MSARAGLDQEMPDGTWFGAALKAAVLNGTVPTATLDGMVLRVLVRWSRAALLCA